MSADLNPVSPTTHEAMARVVRLTGETLAVDRCNVVDPTSGAVTVLLPTSYDDDTIVQVENNSSSENSVVVDGNGETIDGEATFSFTVARGVVSFGRDARAGRWTRLVTPRQLDGAVARVYSAIDMNAMGVGSNASPWRTALEVDFTSLANQVIGADGDFALDGLTWTKRRTASEQGNGTRIVNGTGLTIEPANGTDSAYGAFAIPVIDIPLSSIIPANAYGPGIRLRISLYDATSMAGLNSFPAAVYGVYANTNGSDGFWIQRGINAAGQGMGLVGGDNVTNFAARNWARALDVTNEIQELYMANFGAAEAVASYGAPSSDTFPARSDLVPFSEFDVDASGLPIRTALTNTRLFIGARNVASAPAIVATLKLLRVEYAL